LSDAVIITTAGTKTRRTKRKTRQQIEKELMDIEHRICHGLTDKEIMEELGIKERTFYYYKQKIYERSAKIQVQKTPEEVLAFEVQILKDRLTRLYRHLEQRASAVNTKARDVAVLATVAQDVAIKILKLESEGLKALSGKNKKLANNKTAEEISQN
jgi:hypothetical protein